MDFEVFERVAMGDGQVNSFPVFQLHRTMNLLSNCEILRNASPSLNKNSYAHRAFFSS